MCDEKTYLKLKARASRLPTQAGVYLFKNELEQVIYIGKAKNLRARVRSYFNTHTQSLKTTHLVSRLHSIDYMVTANEVEAYLLEASLVKKHKPKYNIRLKDDKSYPYIRCTVQSDFPRFNLTRRVLTDGALYFGPYTSSWAVQKTIQFLNQSFKIRDCSDTQMRNRSRPCMTYQMGYCTAPCVQYVNKQQYARDVKKSLAVLRGGGEKVLGQLQRKMQHAATKEQFEVAARLRDNITSFQKVLESQNVVSRKKVDKDIVAYYSHLQNTSPQAYTASRPLPVQKSTASRKTATPRKSATPDLGLNSGPKGIMVEVLHIRSGRLIGHRNHFITGPEAQKDYNEWMTSFLNQYYNDNMVPDEIFLARPLGRTLTHLLQQVFLESQKKHCTIKPAVDKESTELIQLAQQNARQHFENQLKKKHSTDAALEQLQSRLQLPHLPRRIECYDISNIQGQQSVASQVVFIDALAEKTLYRKYKIKTVQGSNDFASMREVLTRRLKRVQNEAPDLIVVDGGKGQLASAIKALNELKLKIPVVALAKAKSLSDFQSAGVRASKERVFLPGRHNPVVLAQNSKACHILVALRDEAHRFALAYHRKRRGKKFLQSALDQVPGLGDKRKALLLRRFGGVDKVRCLTANQIAALEGFHLRLAQSILKNLNG